jgi:phosphate transport system protein
MAKHLQRELEAIKKRVMSLGTLVEERVRMAVRAIEDRDPVIAEAILRSDYEIDEMEVEVEEECLKILALHQPVAVDLRFLIAVIKINNDLERIGDEAVNIGQRVISIAKRGHDEVIFDYALMAAKAETMLTMSLDALVNIDVELALKVMPLDDAVDAMKAEAYERIKAAIKATPDKVGALINQLLVSRHLERIADHATNIAEEVVYMIEGEIVRHGNY